MKSHKKRSYIRKKIKNKKSRSRAEPRRYLISPQVRRSKRKNKKSVQKIKYLSGSGYERNRKTNGCGVLDFNTCVKGTRSFLKGTGTKRKNISLRNCKYNFKNQICESVQKP